MLRITRVKKHKMYESSGKWNSPLLSFYGLMHNNEELVNIAGEMQTTFVPVVDTYYIDIFMSPRFGMNRDQAIDQSTLWHHTIGTIIENHSDFFTDQTKIDAFNQKLKENFTIASGEMYSEMKIGNEVVLTEEEVLSIHNMVDVIAFLLK